MVDNNSKDGFNTALEPWQALLYKELAVAPHYSICLSLEASYPVPPPAHTMYAMLTDVKPLTPSGYNHPITFMEFDLSDCDYQYNVGDSLSIHLENKAKDVLAFLKWYGINP